MIFDRTHLAYLNLVEKINCALLLLWQWFGSLSEEIAAHTEQYWCPIKHARRTLQSHAYYSGFVDYGDTENLSSGITKLSAMSYQTRFG